MDAVGRIVIGNTADGLACLLLSDNVVIIAGCHIVDLGKVNVCTIVFLGFKNLNGSPVFIGLNKIEGELDVTKVFAFQCLGRLELHSGSGGDAVYVDEIKGGCRRIFNGYRSLYAALVIVFHNDLDLILCAAVGQTIDGVRTVFLQHVVEGLANVLSRIVQGNGIIMIFGICGCRFYCLAGCVVIFVSFEKLKGEAVAGLPFASADDLFTGQGNVGTAGYLVNIHEGDGILRNACTVIDMNGCVELPL